MPLTTHSTTRQNGFTRLELLVVIFVATLLIIVLGPEVIKRTSKASMVKCSSHLKQVALSFKMYAGDNDGRFPWIPKSPAENFTNQLQVWEYFQTISNELGSTQILLCPQDVRLRRPAYDFSNTIEGLAHPTNQNNSISYFLGVDSSEPLTNAILTGDRILSAPNSTKLYRSRGTTPVEVSTNATWSSAPAEANHNGTGNYALADGSVQQASNDRLQEALRLARDSYGTNANKFLFPQ